MKKIVLLSTCAVLLCGLPVYAAAPASCNAIATVNVGDKITAAQMNQIRQCTQDLGALAGGITSSSLGNPGYVQFSNGFMVQWGNVPNSLTSYFVPYGWSFPTGTLHVFLQRQIGPGAGAASGSEMFVGGGTATYPLPTASGFYTSAASAAYPVSYLAIGY